jgi:hypothetical protein
MQFVTRMDVSPLAFLFLAKVLAAAAAGILGVCWVCTRRAGEDYRHRSCGYDVRGSRRCPECGTERGSGMLATED